MENKNHSKNLNKTHHVKSNSTGLLVNSRINYAAELLEKNIRETLLLKAPKQK